MKRRLTLKEIQQLEFNILVEFDRFCSLKDLRYSLEGGTLLGAVRHKDFIPWDDDVDVCMPRSDYEKFCASISDFLPKRYKFIRDSYWPFAKIIDLKTGVNVPELNEKFHLWIDIFPLDGLPPDEKKQNKLFSKIRRLRKMQTWTQATLGKGSTPFRAFAKIPMVLIAKIHKPVYYTKKIEKVYTQIDSTLCKYIAIISSCALNPAFRKACVPEKSFDNRVKLLFHGQEFWAIDKWDMYLKGFYGDYMQLPPEEERKVHLTEAWLEDEIEE